MPFCEDLHEDQIKDIWNKIVDTCNRVISDHTVMSPNVGIGSYESAVAQGYDVEALANWYTRFHSMFKNEGGITVYKGQEYIGTINSYKDSDEVTIMALAEWLSFDNLYTRESMNNHERVINTIFSNPDIKYVLACNISDGDYRYFYNIYNIRVDYIDINDEYKKLIVDLPAGFNLDSFINSLGPNMDYCNLDKYVINKNDYIVWDGCDYICDAMRRLDVDKVGDYIKANLDIPENILEVITPYLDDMMEHDIL